ncbi:MAG: tripartite tricarboxylate transporter permease [Candidatus Aenigmarchaeota archaeon]|nr:tripartite tricarboxylate transporter permease [Candidatus Aenigmarchaeota archaeon]
MFDLLFFCFFGIFFGLLAGLLPGLHPNQIYFLVFGLLTLKPEYFAVFAGSLAISNIISSYIPMLFVSVPDPNNVANILPGHRMVLKGRGLEALKISVLSAVFALLSVLILLPFLMKIIPLIHNIAANFVLVLIVGFVLIVILSEGKKSLAAIFVFIVSGLWGVVTLNSNFLNGNNVLFVALTGLFGLSGLFFTQKNTKINYDENESNVNISLLAILLGVLGGIISGVLPGVGESQIGFVLTHFLSKNDEFLLSSTAAINASNMMLSVITLVLTGRIRSGLSDSLASINFDQNLFFLFLGSVLFSCGISAIISITIGKFVANFISRIDYEKLSKIIIFSLTAAVFIFTGIWGLFILTISTMIGFLPILFNVKRSLNMGFLVFPVIIYYAGLSSVISRILI